MWFEVEIYVVYHAVEDRNKVYDDVMNFFWSCAKAFPILDLVLGLLLP